MRVEENGAEHLPECYLSGPPNLCPMCEALRACEQRVLDEERTIRWEEKRISYLEGQEFMAKAAREAVAELPFFIPDPDGFMFRGGMSDPAGLQVWLDREAVLAAIDELRGES